MKILYVTTIAGTMNFFPEHFKMLLEQGHTIELACNCSTPPSPKVAQFGFITHDIPFSRTPLARDNLKAYKELKRLVAKDDYDIVHCHTPNAAAITRLACKGLKKTKVFYTAHGFHFYKGAPLKNWILYCPVEWLCSFWTHTLITINKEDYAFAKSHLHAKRTEYVPGVGISINKFNNVIIDRANKRLQLGIPEEVTVAINVGELIPRKNQEILIRAVTQVDGLYLLIAGAGQLQNYLSELIRKHGVENRVMLLGYRNDIAEIYKASDFFVFSSIHEGLPVAMMEAMATGLPIICSKIRGNVDLIDNGVGGYLVKSNDATYYAERMRYLVQHNELYTNMGRHNAFKAKQYCYECILTIIDNIYKM